LDDALTDPETKSRPLGCLGSEEWFEQMLCVLFIDSCTGIANGDADSSTLIGSTRRFEDMQVQPTAFRHRLHCVSNQVKKYLFEFDGEAVDASSTAIPLGQNYIIELHAARLQFENLIKERGDGNFNWMLRFPIEAELCRVMWATR
jgi:hypothetical protein